MSPGQRPFEPGERVLLFDTKGRRYLVSLEKGGEFHSHTGTVAHDAILGQEDGSIVRSSRGARYIAVRPTLAEVVLKMPRGAQVIYPKDLGPILVMADIFPGARVLEAGLGSGALSMTLLRAGADVTGYELREDFAARAVANVTSFLGEGVLEPVPRAGARRLRRHRRKRPRPGAPGPARAVARCEACSRGVAARGHYSFLPTFGAPGDDIARGPRRRRFCDGGDGRGPATSVAHRRPGGPARPPHGRAHRLSDLCQVVGAGPVNAFDIGILVCAAIAAWAGWRMGFLARIFSWVGLGAGLYLAVRFMPNVLDLLGLSSGRVQPASSTVRDATIVLAVVLLLGGAFVGQGVGLFVGARLHSVLPFGGVRTADRAVGAFVGVLGVFTALWLLAPSLAAVPPWISGLTTHSVIARWVSNETHDHGLSPPNTLQALRRLVGEDGFPQVFNVIVPAKNVGKPPFLDPLERSAGRPRRRPRRSRSRGRPAAGSRRGAAGRSPPTSWLRTPTSLPVSRPGTRACCCPTGTIRAGDGRPVQPGHRPGPALGARPRRGAAACRQRDRGQQGRRFRPPERPGPPGCAARASWPRRSRRSGRTCTTTAAPSATCSSWRLT